MGDIKVPRIILLSLDYTRPKDPPQSVGHATILANLIHHEIATVERSWAVNHPSFSTEEVISFIKRYAHDEVLIGFGGFVWNEPYIQKIVAEIKQQNIPGRIVLGGPQVSYIRNNPDIEELSSDRLKKLYPGVDIFIRGYADGALVELVQSQEKFPKIQGVYFPASSEPDDSLSAKVDLNSAISPLLTGTLKPKHFLRWETKRGCPFRCAFCQHTAPDANKVYQFSEQRIMDEAEWILAHKEIQDIAVIDPTFNIPGTLYKEVLRKFIRGGYTGKLSLQCRMEYVDDEFLTLIQQLNKTAEVTLEFGLQTVFQNEQKIIRRLSNLEKVKEVLKKTKKLGIRTDVSLIYGLPEQTVESFIQSIEFLVDLEVSQIHAFPLMLLHGTLLYEKKEIYGLKESLDPIPYVVSSNSFSEEEYKTMCSIANSLDAYNGLSDHSKKDFDIRERSVKKFNFADYLVKQMFFKKQTVHNISILRKNDLKVLAAK